MLEGFSRVTGYLSISMVTTLETTETPYTDEKEAWRFLPESLRTASLEDAEDSQSPVSGPLFVRSSLAGVETRKPDFHPGG